MPVYTDLLPATESELTMLLFPCERANPVATARGFERSRNLRPTAAPDAPAQPEPAAG
jgi:hypothetical protein